MAFVTEQNWVHSSISLKTIELMNQRSCANATFLAMTVPHERRKMENGDELEQRTFEQGPNKRSSVRDRAGIVTARQ